LIAPHRGLGNDRPALILTRFNNIDSSALLRIRLD
jgi:hypothetical protein